MIANDTDGVASDADETSLNLSQPAPNSDMSGDDDESQQTTAAPNPMTPSTGAPMRVSAVHDFADKISSHEYTCKLCFKIYRCTPGSNANIRRHFASTHAKANFYSKSHLPNASVSLFPARKKALDEAATKAIAVDSRSFGDFRRVGMQHFLRVA